MLADEPRPDERDPAGGTETLQLRLQPRGSNGVDLVTFNYTSTNTGSTNVQPGTTPTAITWWLVHHCCATLSPLPHVLRAHSSRRTS